MKIYRNEPGFYDKLKEIQNHQISYEFRWSGPYAIFTYHLPNGEIWEYMEDTDYGVSYSLEKRI